MPFGRRGRALALVTGIAGVALVAASCSSSGGPATTVSAPPTSATSTTTTTSAPAQVPDASTAGPLGALQGGAAPVPAPTGTTVSVPASIPADCSKDVSGPLKHFLKKLPDNTTVLVGAQACYQVDKGIKLNNPVGLTIYGGTFTSDVTQLPAHTKPTSQGATFTFVGGSNVTLEAMKITGQNPGGYHPTLAFAAGINVEGTKGITVKGVTITNTFGDGITLSPLRGGPGHNTGVIVNPTSNAVIQGVTITGIGRQAVTLASISGAQIGDLVIQNPGQTTFDAEADQSNEGAVNVTIDGCTSSGGGVFFANLGAGAGKFTHDITVAHCAMAKSTSGEVLLVHNVAQSRKVQRGPIDFVADVLHCGASVSVACIQLSGATVSVENSVLTFPKGTVHEPVYRVGKRSTVVFTNDAIHGFGRSGKVSKNSTVHVHGGQWVSVSGAVGAGPGTS
jgi:hypothetical protein